METQLQDLKTATLEKVVQWMKSKGYGKIKAKIEGFEEPSAFTRSETDRSFIPDATAIRRNRKNYFEVAVKDDDTKRLVRKWKLLSTLATMKSGKFFLFAPRGHKAFAQRIVKDRNLNAEVVSI